MRSSLKNVQIKDDLVIKRYPDAIYEGKILEVLNSNYDNNISVP